MKKYIKYIIAIILIVVFTISVVPKSFQNDTFYIIPLGQHIMENGIDKIDHYSWHDNLEYRYPHWLFDVVNASIYNIFDINGLYIFVCTISVIFMLIIFWLMLKKNINWVIAFASTLLVIYLTNYVFTDRGQIISYLMFLIEMVLIERFLEKKDIFSVIWLFVVSCIIANVHATAWIMFLVLFLPYIGEYIISLYTLKNINYSIIKKSEKKLAILKSKNSTDNEKIEKLEKEIKHSKEFIDNYKERENAKIIITKNDNAKWLILVMIIASLGALITPLGSVPFTYYLKTSVGNTLTYINEHLPIIMANNFEFLVFSIILVAMICFTDSKLKLSDAFLILGLYIMTISSRRNLYLLIILCAIPITKMVNAFIMKNIIIDENNISLKKFLDITYIIFCIVILGITIYNFVIDYNEEHINSKLYPIEATEWIKNNLDYKNIKLYNDYNFGSYLLWKDIPVFIDSRCDLYTPEFNKDIVVFDDYMDMKYGEITYNELFEKYEITHAIVYKESLENTYMSKDKNCKNLYEDDCFVIYKYNVE